jgi:hypothetical protein
MLTEDYICLSISDPCRVGVTFRKLLASELKEDEVLASHSSYYIPEENSFPPLPTG